MRAQTLQRKIRTSKAGLPLSDMPERLPDADVVLYLYSPKQEATMKQTREVEGRNYTQPVSPRGKTYSEMISPKQGEQLRSTSRWDDFVVVDMTFKLTMVPCPTCKGRNSIGVVNGQMHACSTCNGFSSISRELYEQVYAPK